MLGTGALLPLVILTSSLLVVVVSNDCCPSSYLNNEEQYCQTPEHTAVDLKCSHGMYLLDPVLLPEDTFQLQDEGLVVGIERTYVIENGSFCVARLKEKEVVRNVAFVCFDEEDSILEISMNGGYMKRHLVNGIFLSISAVFLFATFLVYSLLPEVLDLDGKCLMGYVFCLGLAYITLAVLQFTGHTIEPTVCIAKAFFLYFWMLSAFFWLNVVSFNIWCKTLRLKLPVQEQHLFPIYCAYGSGTPLLFLMVALITHHIEGEHIKPNFGANKCWFEGHQETWAFFYGPIAILLTCNVVFFVWSMWCLWQDYRHIHGDGILRSLRFKCLMYLKMFLLMGITWIFELISYGVGNETPFFWYVTDIFNCLQGVIIFLLVVVLRKKVVRGLVHHKPWGLSLPHSWAKGIDEESEAIIGDEEISHTQIPMDEQPKLMP